MIARLGFMIVAFIVVCAEAKAQQQSPNRRIAITDTDKGDPIALSENEATITARRFLKNGRIEKARRILDQEAHDVLDRRGYVDDRIKWIRKLSLYRKCDDIGAKCLGLNRRGNLIAIPPYKLAEPRGPFRERPGCGVRGKLYALVPAAEIKTSRFGTVEKWSALARAGSVFSCQGPSCITIVETMSENEGPSNGLAACVTAKVGTSLGAPANCIQMYQKDETGEHYLGVVGTATLACQIGRPDFMLIVEGLGEGSRSTILAQSKKALVSEPLKLETEIHENYVLGVSDRRTSSVLSGFNETITVRIELEKAVLSDLIRSARRMTSTTGPLLGTVVSTDILVNKQKTDRPSDWHLAAESQQQVYVREVKAALKNQFSDLCPDAEWLDDRIMLCPEAK